MTARTIALVILLLAVFSSGVSARRFGLGHLGLGMGKLGAADSQGSNGVAPVTRLRITNTGAFRITNTGANRAVFP